MPRKAIVDEFTHIKSKYKRYRLRHPDKVKAAQDKYDAKRRKKIEA